MSVRGFGPGSFLYSSDDGVSPWIKERRRFHPLVWWTDILSKLDVSTTLYVGNMSFNSTEEQIYKLFSQCGQVKKVIMGMNKQLGKPCGFCFVEYFTHEDALDARRFLSGMRLDDRV